MRRQWVAVLAVLTLLGVLAPPAFAQAPAPKVTITGLFDLVTAWSSNREDIDTTRRETEWFSRQRGRLDFIGELGKAKMVWGIELDFTNGQGTHGGTSAGFDLDTDVPGFTETKWLYVEFPFTGKDSLLPFIEVPTMARGGGQPFVGHDYKPGILATGDFGGLNLETTFSPTVKNTFTFVQIEECLNRGKRVDGAVGCAGTTDSVALIDSVEVAVTKEITVKPTVSYASFGGINSGTATLGTPPRGGFTQGTRNQWRSTVGGDVRWKMGPWSFEPTFHYQFGEQNLQHITAPCDTTSCAKTADISAWIVDAIGGWRQGPALIEARFVYTTGNKASECVQTVGTANCAGGDTINYYTPINPGFVYFATPWTEIWSSGTEYSRTFLDGRVGQRRGVSVGHDKYGLIALAVRGSYAVTPAFTLVGLVSPSWTAEKVDTNGDNSATAVNGIVPRDGKGDERFLGTEVYVGFTWSFAPGLTFDWRYAHLFSGDALNQCRTAGGCATQATVRSAKDVDLLVARVRYTF